MVKTYKIFLLNRYLNLQILRTLWYLYQFPANDRQKSLFKSSHFKDSVVFVSTSCE